MTGSTKDQQRIQELEADNAQLRGQLAATGATPAPYVGAPVQLTEGDRQQLEQTGYATLGGVVYTVAEARELLKRNGQDGVTITDPSPAVLAEADRIVKGLRRPDVSAQRGLTHVWPSVEPGAIDPAVAGQPGISGPAATPVPPADTAR